jgi:hypothetical protein
VYVYILFICGVFQDTPSVADTMCMESKGIVCSQSRIRNEAVVAYFAEPFEYLHGQAEPQTGNAVQRTGFENIASCIRVKSVAGRANVPCTYAHNHLCCTHCLLSHTAKPTFLLLQNWSVLKKRTAIEGRRYTCAYWKRNLFSRKHNLFYNGPI